MVSPLNIKINQYICDWPVVTDNLGQSIDEYRHIKCLIYANMRTFL